MLLTNAFSLNMLSDLIEGQSMYLKVQRLSMYQAIACLQNGFQSAIGHTDTASILSNLLGMEVPMNRCSVSLGGEAEMVVAQYRGPRLPEGTTKLPEGSEFVFYLIQR